MLRDPLGFSDRIKIGQVDNEGEVNRSSSVRWAIHIASYLLVLSEHMLAHMSSGKDKVLG